MHSPGSPTFVAQAMLDRVSRRGDKIMLILDTKGIVQYCSSPAWFSGIEGGVEGKPITTLVPRLPLRSKTPGYNVAYARFAWGDHWQRQMVNVGASETVAMDMLVKAVPIGHGYCLVVALKAPTEVDVGYIAARKSPGQTLTTSGDSFIDAVSSCRLPDLHREELRA